MRTNTTLKTKAMSILLAIVVLLGMLPISVFAADESTVITITNDNVNDESDAYLVDDPTLLLGGGTDMGGTHSFVLGPNPDESAFTFFEVRIGGWSTVQGGKAVFKYITNFGTVSGGSFDPESNRVLFVNNTDTGDISDGTFNGNQEGILSVENYGTISGGTFYGTVTNDGTISDGTFEGEVTNNGTISGGTFSKGILNMGGTIADGVNATVAQGGDLAITMQTLGTGSITVKQKGIDIPSGKAGETYNVAASGGTLTIAAEPAQGTEEWDEWYTPISDGLMAAYMLHTHSYSAATCSTPATCSCGATTGDVDSTNHTGRTEVRGQKDATEFEDGYTGDTYCLGCNTMIKQGGVIGATHTHSYTKEAYHSAGHWTACDCGEKTEVQAHSYTGILDTTCDCGYNRSLFVTNDDGKDFFEVGFIPGDDVTLPDDAELVVEDHYPSLAPIASTIVKKTSLGDFQCPEEYDILTDEDAVVILGIKCRLYETLMIDGREYILWGNSQDGPVLIRFPDGRGMVYSRETGIFTDYPDSSFDRTVEKPTNTTVTIDGVTYDVGYILNNSTYILYRDGQLAGMYPSTDAAADLHGSVQFYEGYDPETLKAQQDDNDLGSVTIPADYNNAAIADLAPGKTYKVSVIGSNDISVEGLTEVNGTVTQTFKIPDALVGAKNVKYVAVYDTNPYAAALAEAERVMNSYLVGSEYPDSDGYNQARTNYVKIKAHYDAWEKENGSGTQFGELSISQDGKTVTATYAVDSFSPFIVYAFVEADEPEYKELSATLHTEHTGGTATCKDKAVCETCGESYGELAAHTYENGKCTVCQAIDPDYVPEGSNPQTGDNSHLALWIALLFISGGAVITLTVVDRKRRTANR